MKSALFRTEDGHQVQVDIVRRGRNNSRVIFQDGHQELVPTASLDTAGVPILTENLTVGGRVVPMSPLRLFYRALRALTGTRADKFHALRRQLSHRHGPGAAAFLAELFVRSKLHLSCYHNSGEAFYGNRLNEDDEGDEEEEQEEAPSAFANKLVKLLNDDDVSWGEHGLRQFRYVDYEISPIRTTHSVWESGQSAKNSGAGGMDLLLVTESTERPLPAVGEIKAKTEQVGPTFALIQTMTYAAELVTSSQWQRLGQHFPQLRATCVASQSPKIDIIVLLERPVETNDEDFRFAKAIADSMMANARVNESIRHIRFFECGIDDGIANFVELP